MRTVILSLSFMVMSVFITKADEKTFIEDQVSSALLYCTDCWAFAEGAYYATGDFADWDAAYDHCNENKDPCTEDYLEEVILEG